MEELPTNVSLGHFCFSYYGLVRILPTYSVSFGDIYFLHYVLPRLLNISVLDYDILRIVIDKNAIDFDTYSKIQYDQALKKNVNFFY